MLQLLQKMKRLDKRYKISIVLIIINILFSLSLAIMSQNSFIWGIVAGQTIALMISLAILYYKTKGFNKFAKVNDERLLQYAETAWRTATKFVGVIAIVVAGFLTGRLIATYENMSFTWTNENVIIVTIIATIATIVLCSVILQSIIYCYLKKQK